MLVVECIINQDAIMQNPSLHAADSRPPAFSPDVPRIIIWQIAPPPGPADPLHPEHAATRHDEPLNTSECMLVIDSIARTSKPIVVLIGDRILERYPRLPEILEYGRALGLKMIVEVTPDELSDEVLESYARFGERIFRVKLGDSGKLPGGGSGGRMDELPSYDDLERCLDRLEDAGYETHLVYTAAEPDVRTLATVHDYAVRRSAKGLYCHLRFDLDGGPGTRDRTDVDDFIRRFATMKEYSPASMIISPQCVKFEHQPRRRGEDGEGPARRSWEYTCLAGKSYAFIDGTGNVQLCGGSPERKSPLRDAGYDFRKIWSQSPAFPAARKICRHCLHGYHTLRPVDGDLVSAPAPGDGLPPPSGGAGGV